LVSPSAYCESSLFSVSAWRQSVCLKFIDSFSPYRNTHSSPRSPYVARSQYIIKTNSGGIVGTANDGVTRTWTSTDDSEIFVKSTRALVRSAKSLCLPLPPPTPPPAVLRIDRSRTSDSPATRSPSTRTTQISLRNPDEGFLTNREFTRKRKVVRRSSERYHDVSIDNLSRNRISRMQREREREREREKERNAPALFCFRSTLFGDQRPQARLARQ